MSLLGPRLAEIRLHQAEDLAWVEERLSELSAMTQKCSDVQIDLATERSVKRDLYKEKEDWKAKFEELQNVVDRNSFCLVLIDADSDAYMFDDEYILDGLEGGRRAAFDLTAALKRYACDELRLLSDPPCLIKLYANIDKVKQALHSHDMHDVADKLRDFYKGFCQMGGLTDVIDVGDGADQADHQIKGVLGQFKGNPCCKQIVLGSCHDNGYVASLNAIVPDEGARSKVTLLKSFQTGRQYEGLPYSTTRFPELFRKRSFGQVVRPSLASELGTSAPPQDVRTVVQDGSYASIAGRASDTAARTIATGQTAVSDTSAARLVLVNNQDQRVDKSLPKLSQSLWNKFEASKKVWQAQGKKGPCNQHIFFQSCFLGAEDCSYSHAELSAGDLLVQRVLVRKQPCTDGSECRNPKCPYGHHCICTASGCRFRTPSRDLHGISMHGLAMLSFD